MLVLSTRKRYVTVAVAAVLYFGHLDRSTLRAQNPALCENACGPEAWCGEECYPTQFDFDQDTNKTTCEEWDGGYWEDSCTAYEWDDCSFVCPTEASSATCYEDGDQTTCGSYGAYLQCGDDVCAVEGGETEGNCSADCDFGQDFPATLPSLSETDPDDVYEEFAIDMDSVVSDDGESEEDIDALWHLAYQYGFFPDDTAGIANMDFDFQESCSGYCTKDLGQVLCNFSCSCKKDRKRAWEKADRVMGGIASLVALGSVRSDMTWRSARWTRAAYLAGAAKVFTHVGNELASIGLCEEPV